MPGKSKGKTAHLLKNSRCAATFRCAVSKVTAFGVVPKMSETPGTVWRGAPTLGQDTETILKTILGYDDGKIAVLKEKGFI